MSRIKFTVEEIATTGFADEAIVLAGDDPVEAVTRSILQDIGLDIEITAGGVTASLAMWRDPEGFETEWEEALSGGTFEEYVAALAAELGLHSKQPRPELNRPGLLCFR